MSLNFYQFLSNNRLGNIVVASDKDENPITADDLVKLSKILLLKYIVYDICIYKCIIYDICIYKCIIWYNFLGFPQCAVILSLIKF